MYINISGKNIRTKRKKEEGRERERDIINLKKFLLS